jgi:hypothetical protein
MAFRRQHADVRILKKAVTNGTLAFPCVSQSRAS